MSDSTQTAQAAREQTGEVAGTAREQTDRVAGTAKEQTRQVTETAKAEAAGVAGTAAEQARTVLDEVTADVTAKADEQAGRLGERLRELSKQLQSMAAGSDEQGLATSAVRSLGEQSERLADKLSSDGTAGVVGDVRRYARNNPGSFLLGAAVAGLAAGRLTRGAKDQSQQSSGASPGAEQRDAGVRPVAGVAPAPVVPPVAPVPVAEPYPVAPETGGRL